MPTSAVGAVVVEVEIDEEVEVDCVVLVDWEVELVETEVVVLVEEDVLVVVVKKVLSISIQLEEFAQLMGAVSLVEDDRLYSSPAIVVVRPNV